MLLLGMFGCELRTDVRDADRQRAAAMIQQHGSLIRTPAHCY
jgi:hypothetical protein